MTDIRKRTGRNGRTRYQVRFRGPKGYEYRSFDTAKEARAFREDGSAQKRASRKGRRVISVEDGVQTWLDVCEKEGRNGREPVTPYTPSHPAGGTPSIVAVELRMVLLERNVRFVMTGPSARR